MVKIIYIKGILIIQHLNSITLDIIDTEYLFASKKNPSVSQWDLVKSNWNKLTYLSGRLIFYMSKQILTSFTNYS